MSKAESATDGTDSTDDEQSMYDVDYLDANSEGLSVSIQAKGTLTATMTIEGAFDVEFRTDKSRYDADEETITLRDRNRNDKMELDRADLPPAAANILVALII
jgi:hypothetical protein